jgi:hypothetical protein
MSGGVSLRRVTSLPFQKMNHEALVVDPRTRSVHLLNPTATRVWDLLEAPHTAEQLATILGREFDAPDEVLRAELTTLLTELEAKGLVGADARDAPEFPGPPDEDVA